MAEKPFLAVFDVEGIIIPGQRYFLETMKLLDLWRRVNVLYCGLMYSLGLMSLRSALIHIYHQFEGVEVAEFIEAFERIPLIPGSSEVMDYLKRSGIMTAFISSSVADVLLERLASRLRVDHFVGPTLDVLEGILTGKVTGDVIQDKGKALALTKLLQKLKIIPRDCSAIADDWNNLSMFNLGVRSIGFNPDFILNPHCQYVVRGNLTEVLPFLDPNVPTKMTGISLGTRETIHMGSFLIPLLCRFFGLDRLLVCLLIISVSVGYLVSEIVRVRGRSLPPLTAITQSAAVAQEQWDYAIAPLLFAIGVVFTLLVFPSNAAYVGVTVATLGDGIAKVVGKRWGKRTIPFNKPKTLEGTLAGLAVSALAGSMYTSPPIALFAAAVGMTVEALPSPVNDNLSVPFIVALTISIVS